MPHDVAGMVVVQDTSKGFCQVIGGVDHIRDELHNNGPGFFPVLDGKVLDVNVMGALSRDASVDHIDGQLVVAEQDSGSGRRETQIGHDGLNIASMLCSSDGSKEFCFSRASCSDRLCLASVGDGVTAEKESVTHSGATIA